MNNNIRYILANRNNRNTAQSRISPIARMGQPVQSKYTRAAERLSDPSLEWGYVKGGDIAAGLTAGLKGYLGMRGAMEDMRNQQAYNDYLAQAAEQERQDKLGQQAFENDYKERQLAQQAELAQNQLSAQAAMKQQEIEAQNARAELARQQALADRADQRKYEQKIYDRNRADTLSDTQAANDAKAQAQFVQDMDEIASKRLSPEKYNQWRENPQGYDIRTRGWYNPARWINGKNYIEPKNGQQTNFSNVSNEDLLKGL